MRRATLYTVESHPVVAGDYLDFVTIRNNSVVPIQNGEFIMPTFSHETIPVHHIWKIERGQKVNQYIAIHPELREIIEATFLKEFNDTKRELSELRCKVDESIALPWWKRIVIRRKKLLEHVSSGFGLKRRKRKKDRICRMSKRRLRRSKKNVL